MGHGRFTGASATGHRALRRCCLRALRRLIILGGNFAPRYYADRVPRLPWPHNSTLRELSQVCLEHLRRDPLADQRTLNGQITGLLSPATSSCRVQRSNHAYGEHHLYANMRGDMEMHDSNSSLGSLGRIGLASLRSRFACPPSLSHHADGLPRLPRPHGRELAQVSLENFGGNGSTLEGFPAPRALRCRSLDIRNGSHQCQSLEPDYSVIVDKWFGRAIQRSGSVDSTRYDRFCSTRSVRLFNRPKRVQSPGAFQ